jgi:hypothetical protein
MGMWTDAVEAKARIIHAQLAAARAIADRVGMTGVEEPYLKLLSTLYEDEFAFARMVDASDLVARFVGPAVRVGDPRVGVVMGVFADLREEIRRIARSIAGLSTGTDRRLRWPAHLDPHLAGLAQGSLIVGIRVPDPTVGPDAEPELFPEVVGQVFESVRTAVRSLAIVSRHVREDGIDENVVESFPDPAVRDTVLVAAKRIAPTGRRGIESVSLYGPGMDAGEPRPLTARSRQVLTRELATPIRTRVHEIGTFEGVVREIDLDARRFEIRNARPVGSLRCVYTARWDTNARRLLDARVRVTGRYETLPNQQPRLVAVDSIDIVQPPPEQIELSEEN